MNADPLAELRALAMPEMIGWWPIAIGWWVLLALILLVMGIAVVSFRRWRLKHHWRYLANQEHQAILSQHQAGASKDQVIMQVSKLFRQIAITLLSREEVAAISGQQWLVTLNMLGNTTDFTEGAGHVLGESLWQKPKNQKDINIDALLDLQKQFIRNARVLG